MIIRYATPRNASGNRNKLIVDYVKKVYSRTAAHWLCRDDFIEITKTDKRKLENILDENGFLEIDTPL